MIIVIQPHQVAQHAGLLDKMYRLRKKVFHDQLGWEVPVAGDREIDAYDRQGAVYVLWTDAGEQSVYGAIRLMPTTGPTLLYDVFRRTFPEQLSLTAPGIWEGTRMALVVRDHPDMLPARAFCLLLLALCEVALAHGIHTLISNYEPHLKRLYQKGGAELDEIGRADGFGKRPVCCGVFEVSERILFQMRDKLGVEGPLYRHPQRRAVRRHVRPALPLLLAETA